MKKIMQAFLYLVIIILVLQVIKRIIGRTPAPVTYFTNVIINSVQTFVILGFMLVPLFFRAARKYVARKAVAWTVAVFLFIASIAACEWTCRWWLYHPPHIPGFLLRTYEVYSDQFVRHLIQTDSTSAVYSDKLFYTLKPNSRFLFSNIEFSTQYATNSKGLRDDENSLVKPSVICLGDSYAMGWGVQQDSTFSSYLETIAQTKVLNAGISSYGTAREITSLQQFDTTGLRYLLVQYCDNDISENLEFIRDNYVLKVSSRQVYQEGVMYQAYTTTYYPGKHFLNLLQFFIKSKVNAILPVFKMGNVGVKNAGPVEQCKVFLDVLAKAPVDFTKTRVIFFRLVEPAILQNKFEEVADSLIHLSQYQQVFHNNIRVLPLKQELSKDDYYILDPHLTSKGQRKVAEAAYRLMQSF